MAPQVRNARAEAASIIDGRFEVRVLEPSPPAVHDGEWFADDPAAIGEVASGARVVTPTSASELTWNSLAAESDVVAAYARDHWLMPRELPALPAGLVEARRELNRLAFYVLSPARVVANDKMALRYTAGGFGTPFFGDDVQLRVEGSQLVRQSGGRVEGIEIGSLADAAAFASVELDPSRGAEFDVPEAGDVDRVLAVDATQVAFLGDWFGFATAVLEEVRLAAGPDDDASRVQLWPEHFDPAVEIGSAEAGSRASYGGSPGDDAHDEPYLYVAAWGAIDRADPYWNDDAFNGASLAYRALARADDPIGAGVDFMRAGLAKLTG